MDDTRISQRIKDMKLEVFPLDRMLSKSAVLSIFLEMYNSQKDKMVFLRNNSPTHKRLREGYWSLFACAAMDILEEKDHFILFPSAVSNDVYFLSENDMNAIRPKVNGLPLDVKEYTSFSSSKGFDTFISQTINKNRELYSLIVGIHEDVGNLNLSSLFYDGEDKGIFIIASDSKNTPSIFEARVIFLKNDQVLFNQAIDLSRFLEKPNPRIVFQDLIRGLPN